MDHDWLKPGAVSFEKSIPDDSVMATGEEPVHGSPHADISDFIHGGYEDVVYRSMQAEEITISKHGFGAGGTEFDTCQHRYKDWLANDFIGDITKQLNEMGATTCRHKEGTAETPTEINAEIPGPSQAPVKIKILIYKHEGGQMKMAMKRMKGNAIDYHQMMVKLEPKKRWGAG